MLKYIIYFQLILVSLILLIAFVQPGQSDTDLPNPVGFVNDFDDLLTDRQEEILDSLLTAIEQSTQIEIAIVTIDSVMASEENFEDYTFRLAQHWGVGKVDLDNGILIGVSSTLRKIRIQNGIGIERQLSDEQTKRIIEGYFTPKFREGDYFEGFRIGIISILTHLGFTIDDTIPSVDSENLDSFTLEYFLELCSNKYGFVKDDGSINEYYGDLNLLSKDLGMVYFEVGCGRGGDILEFLVRANANKRNSFDLFIEPGSWYYGKRTNVEKKVGELLVVSEDEIHGEIKLCLEKEFSCCGFEGPIFILRRIYD